MIKPAYLVLQDGSYYQGESFGSNNTAIGELVFNTSMTGYQEMLTDPSYSGQIVMPTYPIIGNYGINEDDLKNDGTLLRKINNFVKSRIEENLNVSYGVFKTTYEQKYCYCIKYSSMVQSYKELLDDQDIG